MKTYNLLENSDFAKLITEGSRLLGIDPGKRNVGIAICDPSHLIATPYETIQAKKLKNLLEELDKIIIENNIKGIVVGHPINMDGTEGPRSQSTKDFVKHYQTYSLTCNSLGRKTLQCWCVQKHARFGNKQLFEEE